VAAISKITDLIYAGNGWNNYDSNRTVQENIEAIYSGDKPDIVVAYKPLKLKNFKNIEQPKCIRYNEMWAIKKTTREILDSRADLVICHHLNDIPNYKVFSPNTSGTF